MLSAAPIRVAALVDLARSPHSGGHVKCWERLAQAAAAGDLPLDLTVYFSGPSATEELSPRVRYRYLPPVFSTERLNFLPYVPDHSDLAPYHPRLARELAQYSVLHTTDAFFAFARTAERVSRRCDIPLVTSMHTDTPSYTRIFTRHTIEQRLGGNWLARTLLERWNLPERQGRRSDRRLRDHVSRCDHALATRGEDHELADDLLGAGRVGHLRLGIDKAVFGPHRRDRAAVERMLGTPKGQILILFVGRLDTGKNIHTLIHALRRLRADGAPVHLVTAGLGPAAHDIRRELGGAASVLGYVAPADLARLYASVDVLALVSEVEIRSMVGVEAMASGCPVLVSRKSGVAPLFDHTPAMRQVTSGAAAWAAALRAFCADREGQRSMALAALRYSACRLASWGEVLEEDLFAIWRRSARRDVPVKQAA